MFLYLVQHAEAKREEDDPARPLSDKGFRDIKKTAMFASGLDLRVDMVFHSAKLRGRQTAEILAETLKPTKGITEVDGLSPMDDPAIWAERLISMPNNIVLTGHLPHLGKLAALLLCGDANKNVISFRMAGFVCLKKEENGSWSLQWMITPEIVPEGLKV